MENSFINRWMHISEYFYINGVEGIEDYINTLLVTKNVRGAYLIQNFNTINNIHIHEERLENILSIFPNIHIITDETYTFLSKNKLSMKDIQTEEQIGNLLAYKCDNKFDELDRDKITYTYDINVKLKDSVIDKDSFDIITFMCQDLTYKDDIYDFTNTVKETIMNDSNLVKIVDDVVLYITENQPLSNLNTKIIDPSYTLTNIDIDQIKMIIINVIANEDVFDILVEHLDYNNLFHRGIIASFMATFFHDELEPLYPLQLNEHREDILEIRQHRIKYLLNMLIKTKQTS